MKDNIDPTIKQFLELIALTLDQLHDNLNYLSSRPDKGSGDEDKTKYKAIAEISSLMRDNMVLISETLKDYAATSGLERDPDFAEKIKEAITRIASRE
ncbi:hypothetical protein [Rhodoferax mekongensis]|uniref:hypothetical protein n=1 Tax=Rhodoferax mekongensis TaxID=3068341 RepID=UPI0028BE457F|nr:hypothetical protein [Rhodoferax sp. TBRC 17199]MDT7517100.1 hypothetical protein [Rhodoferax sp. TBRC 17199]